MISPRRGVGLHGVDQGRHEVDLRIGGLPGQPGEGLGHRGVVTVVTDRVEPLDLAGLVLVGDLEDVELVLVVALGEAVHADDRAPVGVELALQLVGGVGDLALEPVLLDALDARPRGSSRSPSSSRWAKISSAWRSISSVRASTKYEPPSGSATWATLVSWAMHLLRAQGDAGRLLGRQGQRLVHGVGVQALRAAEHAGQRLDGRAHDVHLGLLRGEAHAGGLGVEPQLHRALGACAP